MDKKILVTVPLSRQLHLQLRYQFFLAQQPMKIYLANLLEEGIQAHYVPLPPEMSSSAAL
jgi:hypothetical protein